MDEQRRRGVLALGRLLTQESARQVLRSSGWRDGVPLAVALQSETVGDVLDRSPGETELVVMIYDPDKEQFVVIGFAPETATPESEAMGIDIDATVREMPISALEQHALGHPNPYEGMRIRQGRTLAVAV